MTPEELQTYFVETVLYYLSLYHSTRYFGQDPYDINPVIGSRYFPDPEVNEFAVDAWEMTAYCTKPTNAQLEAFTLSTVLDFYNNCYKNPQLVLNAQPFEKLTQSEIKDLEKANIPSGSIVNNITSAQNEILYNSTWTAFPNRSLQTHVRHGTFTSAFNATEVKPVTFTCTNKESVNFTLNTTTGVTTYNGGTQKFKLKFNFSVAANDSATTGQLQSFVNINSETTSIPSTQAKSRTTFIGSSLGTQFVSVEDVLTLDTDDTVALGGYLASGSAQNIDYFDVYAEFSPM